MVIGFGEAAIRAQYELVDVSVDQILQDTIGVRPFQYAACAFSNPELDPPKLVHFVGWMGAMRVPHP